MVKILDMGLARLNEDLTDRPEAMELSGAGQILGTVDYMSPEQAEDVRSADQRSDIYSLGCTLFYLLTRRPVYGGETMLKRILGHRDEPIPSVMELRPDCPAALDAAIRWMLAKRPEDRPQTMAEIIVVLEGCLEKPDAAPPLAAPMPESSESVGNWLEDLVQDRPIPSTEDSQVQEATLGSASADDLPSEPMRTSAGGSSIRRSKRQLHGSGAKKSVPAAGRWKTWKIVTAVMVAAVARRGSHDGTDLHWPEKRSRPRKTTRLRLTESSVAGTGRPPVPSQPIQGSAWEEAWAAAKGRADRLVAQRQFANAIHEYATLAGRFKEPALEAAM